MYKSSRVSVDHDKGVQEAQEVRSGRSSSLPTCLSWAAGMAQAAWHSPGRLAWPRLVGTAQAGWHSPGWLVAAELMTPSRFMVSDL